MEHFYKSREDKKQLMIHYSSPAGLFVLAVRSFASRLKHEDMTRLGSNMTMQS